MTRLLVAKRHRGIDARGAPPATYAASAAIAEKRSAAERAQRVTEVFAPVVLFL
jgi:hypothetical protein